LSVEDVLASKVRLKILKILAQIGELNVSEIARRLGANYVTTRKQLGILEDEGILLRKMFGRIRFYRINERSPKARAIQQLIEAWEAADRR